MQFESVKSMIRNLPPKGTAGLVRQSVSTPKRSPRPPAKTRASVLFVKRLTKRAAGDLISTPMKYAICVYLFFLSYPMTGSCRGYVASHGLITKGAELPRHQCLTSDAQQTFTTR